MGLRGFLTVLLGEKVSIIELLESEGNQLTTDDKFNRVDIKARNHIFTSLTVLQHNLGA